MSVFHFESRIDAPSDTVYGYHRRPGAFERLVPPWEDVRVIQRHGTIQNGDRLTLEIRKGLLRRRWLAVHSEHVPGRQFRDEQRVGPFAQWIHTHRFVPLPDGATRLTDHVDYELPLGVIGRALGESYTEWSLSRMFQFRHEQTAVDLARHQEFAALGARRIAITGASGFVGKALSSFLDTGGHTVLPVTRRSPGTNGDEAIYWDPDAGAIEASKLDGVDTVIHLAGESIADRRWNDRKKRAIRESRVAGTRLLCETLAGLENPPKCLVSASAIGYYGHRGDEWVDETSSGGQGFLADVCRQWEAAAEPARRAGIRVAHLRIGMVLSPKGGALAKMLGPFRFGLGGIVGDGRQYVSWISLDDLVGAIHHVAFSENIEGPVNAVAPNPVTNLTFTKTLGSVLARPTVLPMPAFAARLAFGEMADELLLAGARVSAERMVASGYTFHHPDLETALSKMLGKSLGSR